MMTALSPMEAANGHTATECAPRCSEKIIKTYILNGKNQQAMETGKNYSGKIEKTGKQDYEELIQGVEMVESFFKEYYEQVSDFDPWIDARMNVLKDVREVLSYKL